MDMTELIKLYSINKKQLLFSFINILKSTTKNIKKRKKEKSAQNFLILKYVVKSLKISNFYYQKVLAQLNFLWRYEGRKFLIFTNKMRVEPETLAMKNIKLTAKSRILLDTSCFWIKFGHLRYIGI